MTNKNINSQFDDFFSKQGNKDVPISNSNNSKPEKQKYKGVRVYPDDYEILRDVAHNERKTIVEVISDLVTEKYRTKK